MNKYYSPNYKKGSTYPDAIEQVELYSTLSLSALKSKNAIVSQYADHQCEHVGANYLSLSESSVERFLQEKLFGLKGNLVFKPTDFVGIGFVSDILSKEVLDAVCEVAEYHHQGQMRKGIVPTSYMAHVLGVAGILVNRLEVENPQAILAAILHDVIEDSIEYYAQESELSSGVDLFKIRKERKSYIKVTRNMQEEKAAQIKIELKNKMLDKGLSSIQIKELNLDKVMSYVLAMTKNNDSNLLDEYFAGLISQGIDAVAIKVADRMYNLADLEHVDRSLFAQKCIFGDNNDPGTIVEFIEYQYGDGLEKSSFIDKLSSIPRAKLQFKVVVLKAILESYTMGKISRFSNVSGAIREARRIDSSIDITSKKFNDPKAVFKYALQSLQPVSYCSCCH